MEIKDKRDNLIYVNEETLEVKVNVRNPLGNYKPNKEVYKIIELAEKIKKTKEQFLNDIYNPAIGELIQIIHEYNKNNNIEYGQMVEKKAEQAKQKEQPRGIIKKLKSFLKLRK